MPSPEPEPLPVEWLDPWRPIVDRGQDATAGVERELRREVAEGHPLFGAQTEAIALGHSGDDVLFRLLDGTGRVAVVHLTWTRLPPERPPWPDTAIYASLDEWVDRCMKPEADEYAKDE